MGIQNRGSRKELKPV